MLHPWVKDCIGTEIRYPHIITIDHWCMRKSHTKLGKQEAHPWNFRCNIFYIRRLLNTMQLPFVSLKTKQWVLYQDREYNHWSRQSHRRHWPSLRLSVWSKRGESLRRKRPCETVPARYLNILFAVCQCISVRRCLNWDNLFTAYAISGRVKANKCHVFGRIR